MWSTLCSLLALGQGLETPQNDDMAYWYFCGSSGEGLEAKILNFKWISRSSKTSVGAGLTLHVT